MLFNSLEFLVFFPTVVALYFLLRHRARWLLLLVASSIFYMWFIPAYILVLVFTIVVDYVAGLLIERAQGFRRRAILTCSIVANVGCLVVFKYAPFIARNVDALAAQVGWIPPLPVIDVILPIGLSFHTFQAMSYTIEVYRGHQRAERHFGLYALYVMFFPQLVAGPIERPQNLLPQLHREHTFEYERVTSGLKLMAWGMLKKVVIADRLSRAVDLVYDHPGAHRGPAVLLATVFFAYQIYCDFSGYSDIAIGSARVLGIRLMENFRCPYHSRSVREFWRRWHISLSTWFKDYVFIPLGGSRTSRSGQYRNLMVVFLLSGLWHGANWTFVIWGALHGLYLVGSIATERLRRGLVAAVGLDRHPRLHAAVQVVITFALVDFAWILFRATSLAAAAKVVSRLFRGWGALLGAAGFAGLGTELGLDRLDVVVLLVSVALVEGAARLPEGGSVWDRLAERPVWVRWAAYSALLWWIVFFADAGQRQFIYFVF